MPNLLKKGLKDHQVTQRLLTVLGNQMLTPENGWKMGHIHVYS